MELRCFSLVKAGLTTHKEVLNMNFEEFERLEKFNIMTKKIEELQNEKISSFKGKEKPTESSSSGLSIKNTGEYKRG